MKNFRGDMMEIEMGIEDTEGRKFVFSITITSLCILMFQTDFQLFYMCIYTCTAAAAKSLQSCPTLCDPIDGSPSGFPVPGILQARTLVWVAISFSNA